MVFVRLQHEEGLFESSSQQNSAPGQATMGSHADGKTAVGLAKKRRHKYLIYQIYKHLRIQCCSLIDCQFISVLLEAREVDIQLESVQLPRIYDIGYAIWETGQRHRLFDIQVCPCPQQILSA